MAFFNDDFKNGLRRGGGLCALAAVFSAVAEDWPNFRGPRHNGISNETAWRKDWSNSPPSVAWRAEVGIGFSSFAVAKGRALTIGYVDGEEVVYCLDEATGKKLWTHRFPSELGAKFYIGGPGSTPSVNVETGLVYVLGKWGEVFCLRLADGAVQWNRRLSKEEKLLTPDWAFNGSPLLLGDLAVLNLGKAGLALNQKSGATVWRSQGSECGYSTPVPYQFDGKQMVALSSEEAYSGVDARTGKIHWSIPWHTQHGVNAADPIFLKNRVFVSSGYNKGSGLFALGDDQPRSLWKQRLFRAQQNAPVRIGGFLYGFDGNNNSRAKIKCVDWKTGEVLWEEESFGYGALSAAGRDLIIISAKGRLAIAKASPNGFQLTSSLQVLGPDCWTAPILANGRIFCRNSHGKVVVVDVRTSP